QAPLFLGQRSNFSLRRFGGHATGTPRARDVLKIDTMTQTAPCAGLAGTRPPLTDEWTIGVHYGPLGAPDYFRDSDIRDLFASRYEVHFNSSRTGARLIGPQPKWARADGGEAGLHPSNTH